MNPTLSIVLTIIGVLLGGGGIAAILRARSGVHVDEADAATKVVATSIRLMEELKEERAFARTEVHALKNDLMKLQGRHAMEIERFHREAERLKIESAAVLARETLALEKAQEHWARCEERVIAQGQKITALTILVESMRLTITEIIEGSPDPGKPPAVQVENLHVTVSDIKEGVVDVNRELDT